jgi:hypothetical protein
MPFRQVQCARAASGGSSTTLKKLDQVRSASDRRAGNANAALRTVIRKHVSIPFQACAMANLRRPGGFTVLLAIARGAVSAAPADAGVTEEHAIACDLGLCH